jgi:hypothetical protein
MNLPNDYYWVRHSDGTKYIILIEEERVYAPGIGHVVINVTPDQIICAVKPPAN